MLQEKAIMYFIIDKKYVKFFFRTFLGNLSERIWRPHLQGRALICVDIWSKICLGRLLEKLLSRIQNIVFDKNATQELFFSIVELQKNIKSCSHFKDNAYKTIF